MRRETNMYASLFHGLYMKHGSGLAKGKKRERWWKMGKLIDEYNAAKEYHAYVETIIDRLWTELVKYQTDYENRVKADMVCILEEINMELDELGDCTKDYDEGIITCQAVIQEKIDKLKGGMK